MAHEIAEQPVAIAATLAALRPLRARIAQLAQNRKQILFVARGSSDNAAIYGRYLLEVHAGRAASMAAPSVATHYRRELDLSGALVVCISQSGQTEEIVQTQGWARRCGAATIAVTNVDGSPLAQAADLAMVTRASPERAVPATKTFTTQPTAMAVLATALARDQSALDADLDRVPAEMEKLIANRTGVDAAVTLLARTNEVLVSGRGLAYAAAVETALKLEETCLRPVRSVGCPTRTSSTAPSRSSGGQAQTGVKPPTPPRCPCGLPVSGKSKPQYYHFHQKLVIDCPYVPSSDARPSRPEPPVARHHHGDAAVDDQRRLRRHDPT